MYHFGPQKKGVPPTFDFMGHTYRTDTHVGSPWPYRSQMARVRTKFLDLPRYATLLQAAVRGFLVRVREMNSMLVQLPRDAQWFWGGGGEKYPHLQYDNKSARWKHMLQFNPLGTIDYGFFKGLSHRFLYPQLRAEGGRYVADEGKYGPSQEVRDVKGIWHYNKGTQAITLSRWRERKATMTDWRASRNRLGVKFLDFSRGISKKRN